MRGKVYSLRIFCQSMWITPAYAGKRKIFDCYFQIKEDHPRLCGEKSKFNLHCFSPLGSPPPMRGKGWVSAILMKFHGITPAYAGKRLVSITINGTLKDHPRLCGEKRKNVIVIYLLNGSPPPMRGKEYRTARSAQTSRITPAYAGKRLYR